MRVAFYDPYLPNGAELAFGFTRARTRDELLGMADVVSIHAPLTRETRGMMDAAGRGADGIITDDVELGARFRDELASLPAAAHVLLRFHSLFLDEEETGAIVEQ